MKTNTVKWIMILVAGLCASLTQAQTWYPVYVLDVRAYTLQVMGPSQSIAQTYAKNWEDRIDNDAYHISLRMPFPPDGGIPKPEIYPRDKVLINQVWHVLGDLPTALKTVATVPSLDTWKAIPDTDIDDATTVFPFMGFDFENMPLIVNYDHPSYTQIWRPYTFYYTNYRAYVWYVNAPSKTAAIAAAKAFWITNGVYKLKRPITSSEMMAWNMANQYVQEQAELGVKVAMPTTWRIAGNTITVPDLPRLPWMKLFKSTVINAPTYPTEVPDPTTGKTRLIGMVEPDTFEILASGPYGYYPPYPWRDLSFLPHRSWWR